ncbi:MAG: phage BR0599 family protein, partial [Deltaproteobacteria bacterium]|nr:phage BR0599 family protein [Deltaproteobacteria bacterium]
ASEANMSPGVMDLEGIAGIAGIDRDEIVSGVFDNARVYAFATTWTAPVVDEEPLGVAIMGKAVMMDDRYKAELMMLVDALNQSVGKTYTPSCQKEFGGHGYAGCMVDLAPITVTSTLTAVTGNSVFRDSTRTEAADYFGAGTIAFTTGANAGLKPHKIKEYAADGTITLHEAFHYPVEVGDAYTLIPGCRKRQADCIGWSNIINFGGFSFVPTQSTYTQVGGN